MKAMKTVKTVPVIHLKVELKNFVNFSSLTVEVKFETIVKTKIKMKIGIKTLVKTCMINELKNATAG